MCIHQTYLQVTTYMYHQNVSVVVHSFYKTNVKLFNFWYCHEYTYISFLKKVVVDV